LWVRNETDAGITGLGECVHGGHKAIAISKDLEERLIGRHPFAIDAIFEETRRSRVLEGGFAGALITALTGIEIALWDIAGQVAGVPVYKLLGGKIRDRVRIYNGGFRPPIKGQMPQNYAEVVQMMKEAKEGFTLIKMAVGFHNAGMMTGIPDMWYDEPRGGAPHGNRGPMTERGLNHVIACVDAMKKVLGDQVGLALDAGPGWMMKDAVKVFSGRTKSFDGLSIRYIACAGVFLEAKEKEVAKYLEESANKNDIDIDGHYYEKLCEGYKLLLF
jgi:L-alanine-DL-glutamate epimerase-like enolase superfamily enzyme